MKTRMTLSILMVTIFFTAQAQDCSTGRYASEVFPTFNVTSNITYGANITLTGQNQTLTLDVYEPVGDTETERPLIIWAHGGSFFFGSKTGPDVVPLAEDFAKMGYVTSSINYRLGMNNFFTGPDSVDATETVIRTVHDARAAVRFFRKDYVENGNTYGIDTSMIFFGGVSAGALIGVHLAYLNKESELPTDYVDTSQAGLGGGIEGNSGNPGYSSRVSGVISSAGAIRDTAWMETDDTPIISFHGDNDGTVPYGTDQIGVNGGPDIMEVDGSSSIHTRAENLGMNHCFDPWPGEGHTPHVTSAAYYDTLVTMTSNFLLQFVCGTQVICAYDNPASGIDKTKTESDGMDVYPNPAGDYARVKLTNMGANAIVQMYDAYGREIKFSGTVNGTELIIQRNDLPGGIYFLNVMDDGEQHSAKLIFE